MTPGAQLDAGLAALGIDLPAERRQRLLDFAALLAKWNKTYNLTALRRPDQAVSYHLLDSLAILPYLDGVGSLLDVGSGGGLPGIPLAIARPDLRVALIDSNSKKVAFLRQAAIELGLPNVAAHCDRIEAWRGEAGFEAITSRAFSELADFVALSRHCLMPGGRWLAMKGQRPDEEIGRLPADVRVVAVHRLTVPGVEGERHLVDIREAGVTRNDNG